MEALMDVGLGLWWVVCVQRSLFPVVNSTPRCVVSRITPGVLEILGVD